MMSETGPSDPALAVPILFFLGARPAGENLTIFASEQALADELEVWLAREEPNDVFDGHGRRLISDYRNDTADSLLGGHFKIGGLEHAVVRLAEEAAVASAPTPVALLSAWLPSRTGSTHDERPLEELITRCIEAGAPVHR